MIKIKGNFEKALTFLASAKPWVSEAENLRHRALYLELTNAIRRVIWDKSRDPVCGTDTTPVWLDSLIAYWHEHRCAVITLNYDTLIELVASTTYKKRPEVPANQLYPIRFTPAVLQNGSIQIGSIMAEVPIETFKLFKLHGSINWFYSGRSDFFGEELFCVPCNGGLAAPWHRANGIDPDQVDWLRLNSGKTSLIIPPTLDKSVFFQHEALRSMWFQAGEALKRATRVVCLGYSLPSSDLTMAQFSKNCAPQNAVPFEIVDLSEKAECESKVEHFRRVIGEDTYEFRQKYSGDGCIQKYVVENLIHDPEEKSHARMDCHYLRSQPEEP